MTRRTAKAGAQGAALLPLAEAVVALENERHAARMRTIKHMGAKLAALDAFMPAITAAGIQLRLEDVTDWGGKDLWISAGLVAHAQDARLANVLVASGMRVKRRNDDEHRVWLELVKGRLSVCMSIGTKAAHLLELPA